MVCRLLILFPSFRIIVGKRTPDKRDTRIGFGTRISTANAHKRGKMKILAINGSHRGRKGFTHFLIHRIFKGAIEAGAECEEVVLAKTKMNYCISCGKCNSKSQYLKCVFEDKDDVKSVFDKMAGADLLIYATPIYIFNMSAMMKTFLDRTYSTADVFDLKLSKSGLVFHHLNRDISSKPFVSLICCDNMERETPKNVISYFKTYSRFQDAPLVGQLVRNTGGFMGQGKKPEMEALFPKIAAAFNAFERAGIELATLGRIRTSTQKAANRNVLPIPPLMKLLNRFRPFKRRMVDRINVMRKQNYIEGDI